MEEMIVVCNMEQFIILAGGNLQISNSVFYNNVSQSVGSDIRSSATIWNDYSGNNIVSN